MEVWRIAKWAEVYENAESLRIKNLTWVAWPIKLDSAGYHSLIETFGAAEAPTFYGAWCALVCVAATCPERGTLSDSNGRPYTFGRLALKTHMPATVFERLFAWASTEDVAWLEVTTCPADGWACPGNFRPRGEETRGDERTRPRPSVRRLEEAKEVVIDNAGYACLLPTAHRIARVVTKNPNVEFSRLKAADSRLCVRVAALANERYGVDWLNEILEKLSDRKKKPDNEWGYFRKAVITSVREQFDEDFGVTEKLVVNRTTKEPVA